MVISGSVQILNGNGSNELLFTFKSGSAFSDKHIQAIQEQKLLLFVFSQNTRIGITKYEDVQDQLIQGGVIQEEATKSLLSKAYIFQGLPRYLFQKLISLFTIKSYLNGENVFKFDSLPKGIYIVKSGEFQVTRDIELVGQEIGEEEENVESKKQSKKLQQSKSSLNGVDNNYDEQENSDQQDTIEKEFKALRIREKKKENTKNMVIKLLIEQDLFGEEEIILGFSQFLKNHHHQSNEQTGNEIENIEQKEDEFQKEEQISSINFKRTNYGVSCKSSKGQVLFLETTECVKKVMNYLREDQIKTLVERVQHKIKVFKDKEKQIQKTVNPYSKFISQSSFTDLENQIAQVKRRITKSLTSRPVERQNKMNDNSDDGHNYQQFFLSPRKISAKLSKDNSALLSSPSQKIESSKRISSPNVSSHSIRSNKQLYQSSSIQSFTNLDLHFQNLCVSHAQSNQASLSSQNNLGSQQNSSNHLQSHLQLPQQSFSQLPSQLSSYQLPSQSFTQLPQQSQTCLTSKINESRPSSANLSSLHHLSQPNILPVKHPSLKSKNLSECDEEEQINNQYEIIEKGPNTSLVFQTDKKKQNTYNFKQHLNTQKTQMQEQTNIDIYERRKKHFDENKEIIASNGFQNSSTTRNNIHKESSKNLNKFCFFEFVGLSEAMRSKSSMKTYQGQSEQNTGQPQMTTTPSKNKKIKLITPFFSRGYADQFKKLMESQSALHGFQPIKLKKEKRVNSGNVNKQDIVKQLLDRYQIINNNSALFYKDNNIQLINDKDAPHKNNHVINIIKSNQFISTPKSNQPSNKIDDNTEELIKNYCETTQKTQKNNNDVNNNNNNNLKKNNNDVNKNNSKNNSNNSSSNNNNNNKSKNQNHNLFNHNKDDDDNKNKNKNVNSSNSNNTNNNGNQSNGNKNSQNCITRDGTNSRNLSKENDSDTEKWKKDTSQLIQERKSKIKSKLENNQNQIPAKQIIQEALEKQQKKQFLQKQLQQQSETSLQMVHMETSTEYLSKKYASIETITKRPSSVNVSRNSSAKSLSSSPNKRASNQRSVSPRPTSAVLSSATSVSNFDEVLTLLNTYNNKKKFIYQRGFSGRAKKSQSPPQNLKEWKFMQTPSKQSVLNLQIL